MDQYKAWVQVSQIGDATQDGVAGHVNLHTCMCIRMNSTHKCARTNTHTTHTLLQTHTNKHRGAHEGLKSTHIYAHSHLLWLQHCKPVEEPRVGER